MSVLIVEDQPKFAKHYYNLFYEKDVKENVEIAYDVVEASPYIGKDRVFDKYLIDINLGNKPTGGLELLQKIKTESPESLVIAYSAYQMRDSCASVGLENLHFFAKADMNPDEHFSAFSDLIAGHNLKMQVKVPDKFISYFAQITHVETKAAEPIVKLMCYYDDEKLERYFYLEPVKTALESSFGINKWVKVSISVYGSDTRMKFTRAGRIPLDVLDKVESKFSDEDLMNSSMWDN